MGHVLGGDEYIVAPFGINDGVAFQITPLWSIFSSNIPFDSHRVMAYFARLQLRGSLYQLRNAIRMDMAQQLLDIQTLGR